MNIMKELKENPAGQNLENVKLKQVIVSQIAHRFKAIQEGHH